MKNRKKIIVLGGDGFCGWPTSLHLSNMGFDVTIIDNFSRRQFDLELDISSLTPIRLLKERLEVWNKISGNDISYIELDIAVEYDTLLKSILSINPDTIIHFAEQRSAPYSMKSSWHKRFTVNNNINATNNVLTAIVESELDIHLIHLGTMGVYGYGDSNFKIPEGYLKVFLKNDDNKLVNKEILYPTNPGSIYHMTKSQDQLLFSYFAKNDRLRITDLHQGIVWGTQTEETKLNEKLINRFDYDGDFGTVLNRFLLQAALGVPLTVYGKGLQTRAFINIQDTVKCIYYAVIDPPEPGDKVKIYNQMTEVHQLINLAEIISKLISVKIDYLPNPRLEADSNNLNVINHQFLNHGLVPITLKDGLLEEIIHIAKKYSHRCNISKIQYSSYWNNKIKKNILKK